MLLRAKICTMYVCISLFPLRASSSFLLFSSTRTYWIQTRIGGEKVLQRCDEDLPVLDCGGRQDPTLTVVHGKLDATRCSLVEIGDETGLQENPVGAPVGFSIVSRDSFGNTRCVHRARASKRRIFLIVRSVSCLRIPDVGFPLGNPLGESSSRLAGVSILQFLHI